MRWWPFQSHSCDTLTCRDRHRCVRHERPAASQSRENVEKADPWQITGEEPIPAPSQQTSRPIQLDPRATGYNSLPTGARIENDIGTDGNGKLAVENGTNEDAVVRLSQLASAQTLRWFFVQAHRSAHMERIPEGTGSSQKTPLAGTRLTLRSSEPSGTGSRRTRNRPSA